MTKFILGIAIVAFTSFCGYILAKKYRQRRQFFAQWKEFNERFLTEMAYYRRPLQEFASKSIYKGEFAEMLEDYFLQIQDEDTYFIDLHKSEYSFLKEEEKVSLEDYFSMLGKGDSASQQGYFSSMKSVITAFFGEAETEGKRYGQLYIKMGFLVGVLIIILMI